MHDLTAALIRGHVACLARAAADTTAPAEARARVEAERAVWEEAGRSRTAPDGPGTARNETEHLGTENPRGH